MGPGACVGARGLAWAGWVGAWLWCGALTAQQGDRVSPFRGVHTVRAVVDQRGARLSLDCGWSLLLPPGLPVGEGRLVTLRIAARRARSMEVAPGFVPIGPTVELDGVIAASRAPLRARYAAKRFWPRAGHRLVLASEVVAPCAAPRGGRRPRGGVCATWRLLRAWQVRRTGAIEGLVELPGGARLQFGSLPQ